MLFNSFIFLFFLIIVIPTFYVLPYKYKNIFLLVCSYIFYGYWDWRFTFLLLASTLFNYYFGIKIYNASEVKHKKNFLIISLIFNLCLLGFFKYYNFFTSSFNEMLSHLGLAQLDFLHLNIILPVGISFFTFQTMSYTIDIYRDKLKPSGSLINFSLYVSFFPQLVAGPIERATNLLPQLEQRKLFNKEKFREGFELITIGMFKKIMLGDTTGRIVDNIFADPQYFGSLELLMGLVLFTVQIYSDFSGYSHIARGTAKLLGFELMINFEQPYFSTSIGEFWRRWHISLSTWLKDYVYFPLGGSRKGNKRTYINLFLTMLLAGLWHGAAWTFVIYGILHGIYMVINRFILKDSKFFQRFKYEGYNRLLADIGKILFVTVLVMFTRIFFRADSIDSAMFYIYQLFRWEPSDNISSILSIIFSFVFVTILLDYLEVKMKNHAFLVRLQNPYQYGIITATWFTTLVYLFGANAMPFIYFQF